MRWRRAVSALSLLLCAACGLWPSRAVPEPIILAEPAATAEPTASPLIVHVVGAVARPGVYALPPGARLLDAVGAAGGATPDADLERINLADRARDGLQIYVPYRGATTPPTLTPVAGTASRGASPGNVNINTATLAELDALPGIGPVYGERIIAYRQAHGPFARVEDLLKVQGIGQATVEKIRPFITVE